MKGMTEAVAAWLYNSIYDLTPMEGAWTVDNPRDDRCYLAFAEQLVQAILDHPELDDAAIVQTAKDATTKSYPYDWDTILVGQDTYTALSKEATKYMPNIMAFIEDPYSHVGFDELEFLEDEEEAL